MEGKKYVVQAILIDGDHERVINSTHTDDYEHALDVFIADVEMGAGEF